MQEAERILNVRRLIASMQMIKCIYKLRYKYILYDMYMYRYVYILVCVRVHDEEDDCGGDGDDSQASHPAEMLPQQPLSK